MNTIPNTQPSAGAMRAARAIQAQTGIPGTVDAMAAIIEQETGAEELLDTLRKAEAALAQLLSAAVMAPQSVRVFPPYKLGEDMADDALADVREILNRFTSPKDNPTP